MKKWLYDSKTFGGPFLIQIYNIEPLLAWAIETTKVNTVQHQQKANKRPVEDQPKTIWRLTKVQLQPKTNWRQTEDQPKKNIRLTKDQLNIKWRPTEDQQTQVDI